MSARSGVEQLGNRLRPDTGITISIAIAVSAFYLLAQGTDSLALFANYGLILFAGSAGLLGLLSYARLGKSQMGYVSLGFAIGLLMWMLGLVVYTYYYLIIEVELPYNSLADVFYLLSYPSMVLGCVGLLRTVASSLQRAHWLSVATTGAVLCILVVLYAVIPSVAELTDPLEVLTTSLYPLLDLLVLVLLLPLFVAFRKGIFVAPYSLLALGALLMVLGDLIFTYVNLTIGYYDGHPLDLFWFMSCISFGYGFWRQHTGFNLGEE